MITLTQNYSDWQDNHWTVTHIYSPDGHFERNGKPQGWHIQLGSADSADNYTEVPDGSTHIVPESLPDIYIPEPEPDPDDEATESDYLDSLKELGVTFDD